MEDTPPKRKSVILWILTPCFFATYECPNSCNNTQANNEIAVVAEKRYFRDAGSISLKPNVDGLVENIYAKTGKIKRKVICNLIGIPIMFNIWIEVFIRFLRRLFRYSCFIYS